MRSKLYFYSLLVCCTLAHEVQGQEHWSVRVVQDLIRSETARSNPAEFRLSSEHTSSISGVHYVYLQQQLQGIDIDNAIMALGFDDTRNLVSIQPAKIGRGIMQLGATRPQINVTKILQRIANDLLLPLGDIEPLTMRSREQGSFYRAVNLSDELIKLRPLWVNQDTSLILAQDVRLESKDNQHHWRYLIDAHSGEIIRKTDQVLHCHFTPVSEAPIDIPRVPINASLGTTSMQSNSYRVFPLFVESPAHGDQVVVENPADLEASPFGWHDVDGRDGAEFSDTRGNNTFVQEDRDSDDRTGIRAEGGPELTFDFVFNGGKPDQYLNASLTNLFYWVNINHDLFYHYGFDESAGNFQVNNYGHGGLAGDPVLADAQDGSSRNNATFFSNADGQPARMEMYIWNPSIFDANLKFTGDVPFSDFTAVESDFSNNNKLLGKTVEGKIVRVLDMQPSSSFACDASPIKNTTALKDNIALIDRGSCFFVEKVKNAEAAGARGVIMCNNVVGQPVVMGGTDHQISIPAVMISQEHCSTIIDELDLGNDIQARIGRLVTEDDLDSSLDNLIITHEFGHGISTRLTGGSATGDCLDNFEQMGEGWSDYFGLMLTTDWKAAKGSDRRGVATYLSKQNITGIGIRSFPYSTSLRTNPLRYDRIKNAPIPHGVGAVWCSMLWNMTWEIIEDEGISEDLYFGKAGNNIALQLVIEALKIQPCNPGFVDGRDAILKADEILFDGAHHLAIWKAFAARGLGATADQGHSNSLTDGTSDFTLPPAFLTDVSDFSANDSINSITVSWRSVREINHAEFRISRSTDKSTFKEITSFLGGALKNYSTPYRFEDLDIDPGIWYYYRLDQVGENGFVKEMGLDSAFLTVIENVLVYPNPSRGIFIYKVSPIIEGTVALYLIDAIGKTIWSSKVEAQDFYSSREISIPNLVPGAYFLESQTERGRITQKITVQ